MSKTWGSGSVHDFVHLSKNWGQVMKYVEDSWASVNESSYTNVDIC